MLKLERKRAVTSPQTFHTRNRRTEPNLCYRAKRTGLTPACPYLFTETTQEQQVTSHLYIESEVLKFRVSAVQEDSSKCPHLWLALCSGFASASYHHLDPVWRDFCKNHSRITAVKGKTWRDPGASAAHTPTNCLVFWVWNSGMVCDLQGRPKWEKIQSKHPEFTRSCMLRH